MHVTCTGPVSVKFDDVHETSVMAVRIYSAFTDYPRCSDNFEPILEYILAQCLH